MTRQRRLLWSVFSGAAALAAAVFWRHFFLAHALVVAVAVGVLVFTALGTAERLRSLYRDRP